MIDWDKMLEKQYIPPEPYLKVRFDSFMKLPLSQRTNQEVSDQFKRDISKTMQSNPFMKDHHIEGWSFIADII